MGFGWQEIDKTLDLCYIRVAGLHRECKPAVLFDPPNFRPRTMTHTQRDCKLARKAQEPPKQWLCKDQTFELRSMPISSKT